MTRCEHFGACVVAGGRRSWGVSAYLVICVNVASGTGLEHVAGEAGEFTHVMR